MDSKQRKMCGERCSKKAHRKIAKPVHKLNEEAECTAREVMQSTLEQRKGSQTLPAPQRTKGKPPTRPNVYSDGSGHNPKDQNWQVGGIGVYWPDRTEENLPATEPEKVFTNFE